MPKCENCSAYSEDCYSVNDPFVSHSCPYIETCIYHTPISSYKCSECGCPVKNHDCDKYYDYQGTISLDEKIIILTDDIDDKCSQCVDYDDGTQNCSVHSLREKCHLWEPK